MLPAGVRHPASFGPPQASNTESLATAAWSNCVVHAFNYMLDLVLSMKGSPLHGKRSPSGPATAGMQNVQSARLYRERQGLMVSAIVQYSTSGKRFEPLTSFRNISVFYLLECMYQLVFPFIKMNLHSGGRSSPTRLC